MERNRKGIVVETDDHRLDPRCRRLVSRPGHRLSETFATGDYSLKELEEYWIRSRSSENNRDRSLQWMVAELPLADARDHRRRGLRDDPARSGAAEHRTDPAGDTGGQHLDEDDLPLDEPGETEVCEDEVTRAGLRIRMHGPISLSFPLLIARASPFSWR